MIILHSKKSNLDKKEKKKKRDANHTNNEGEFHWLIELQLQSFEITTTLWSTTKL